MHDMNLLNETIAVLNAHRKTPEDVRFVVGLDPAKETVWELSTPRDLVRTSWAEFEKLANRTYSSGYGGIEVIIATKIVGKDFWLERHEYDGSEWWEYKELPKAEDYPEGNIKVFEDDEYC